jgi:uncharacterized protein
MAPKQRSTAKEILSALDADPALIEHYDPNDIEAIPLAAIHARLVELGLTPAMPVKLQRFLLASTSYPAADVLGVLADDLEGLQPQSIEARPLEEVTARLQRGGINYRAGVAATIDFVGEPASSSASLDQDQTKARSIKSVRLRSRKSLFVLTIGSAATATAAAAATLGFFVTRQVRQDKVIADQQYEIQELGSHIQGLNARLIELRTGADDLISWTMLVPPSNPLEHRTWPPQGDDSNAPTLSVGVAPEAQLGGGSGDRQLDGARSSANIAPPVGVGTMLEAGSRPVVGGLGATAFNAFQRGARVLRAGDTKAALDALEYAARNGEATALWKLGRMYADGDGVKQNDLRAFDYFRTLADSHADEMPGTRPAVFVAKAFVAIGGYYLTGIPHSDVKPDALRAREMFSYAASYFGDPDAHYRLGRMYLDGAGIPKDTKQAMRWLFTAASKGQYEAQAVLGAMLFRGQSVPRDAARGLMWLILARDAATPKETWITDLYNAAVKQASEVERNVALVHVEQWIEQARSGQRTP